VNIRKKITEERNESSIIKIQLTASPPYSPSTASDHPTAP
jgi:hypothetical protein